MSQITIDALDVRVASLTFDAEEFGDFGRAFSGALRSDVRAEHRVARVTTPPLDTSEKDALVAALRAARPGSVSGDQIGTAANFHARSIRWTPITATDYVVSFELHETGGSS